MTKQTTHTKPAARRKPRGPQSTKAGTRSHPDRDSRPDAHANKAAHPGPKPAPQRWRPWSGLWARLGAIRDYPRRLLVANLLAGLGYNAAVLTVVCGVLSVLMAVVWWADAPLAVVLAPVPEAAPPATSGQPSPTASLAATVVAALVTGVMLLLTLWIVITLPYWMARGYARVVRWLAQRLWAHQRLFDLLQIKLILASLPQLVMLGLSFGPLATTASFMVVWTSGTLLYLVSVLCLLLQYLLLRGRTVTIGRVW